MFKIAILGGRGIPANYGGFDTFIEELSVRLAELDPFEIIVYCRKPYFKEKPKNFRGVNLIYLPAPRLKGLESLIHSFLSSIHVLSKGVKVILFVDPGNAPFCLLLKLFGKRVIVHTNGLGWKRLKWGKLARRYYRFTERLCVQTSDAIITDNPAMQEYYTTQYNAKSFLISYGASNDAGFDTRVYKEYGLSEHGYLLVVARLERENNTDLIVQEYVKSEVNMPLVVVGDSPYDPSYMNYLRELANERVHFVGRINDQARLNSLYRGAYLYIHGHEVGGTNPSLLRAMYAGAAPVVLNVPFNTSVIAGFGFIFEKKNGDLSKILKYLAGDYGNVRQSGEGARAYALGHFSWDSVVKQYEELFNRVGS